MLEVCPSSDTKWYATLSGFSRANLATDDRYMLVRPPVNHLDWAIPRESSKITS